MGERGGGACGFSQPRLGKQESKEKEGNTRRIPRAAVVLESDILLPGVPLHRLGQSASPARVGTCQPAHALFVGTCSRQLSVVTLIVDHLLRVSAAWMDGSDSRGAVIGGLDGGQVPACWCLDNRLCCCHRQVVPGGEVP